MNAVHQPTSATSLLTSRFSRHPDWYLEILSVIRRYRLHRIVAELGITHQHIEDVERELPTASEPRPPAALAADSDVVDSSRNVAAALKELGPCFIKLGQLLSTGPDLLPASYIRAAAVLDAVTSLVQWSQLHRSRRCLSQFYSITAISAFASGDSSSPDANTPDGAQ